MMMMMMMVMMRLHSSLDIVPIGYGAYESIWNYKPRSFLNSDQFLPRWFPVENDAEQDPGRYEP